MTYYLQNYFQFAIDFEIQYVIIMSVPSELGENMSTYYGKGSIAMKSTGIVRKVDDLGRIVLPIELRRTLDIAEKDSLEIYVDGPSIVLKKYQPACIFCDDARDVVNFKGKNVCPSCIKELQLK